MTLRIKLYSLAYGLDFLSKREARITSRTIYGGKSPKSCGFMIMSALIGRPNQQFFRVTEHLNELLQSLRIFIEIVIIFLSLMAHIKDTRRSQNL